MTDDELHTKVIAVLARTFGMSAGKIRSDMAYHSDEKWDSLRHLELINDLEAAFDISISTQDVKTMTTVANVEKTVKKYVANK
jgi:acyl carrier protein